MPIRLNAALERILPEKRVYLKSDDATRVIHLRPVTQLGLLGGTALLIGWAMLSGAVLAYDRIGGTTGGDAPGSQAAYEARLSALAGERDARAAEAQEAQLRFAVALDQVSQYQSELLATQQQARELEAGLDAVQQKLGSTIAGAGAASGPEKDLALDALNEQLRLTAEARDAAAEAARIARAEAATARAEQEQILARNEEIFTQIEDAAAAAALPYQDMFASLGLDTDRLLAQVDSEYSGQGGPLTPEATVSTSGNAGISQTEARGKEIVVSLDQVSRYRIASNKLPLDMPVKSAFRFSSGFGARWGRAHKGVDFAAPVGTPIFATGDGTVTFAGRQSGYGNVIIVEHALGTETRYAHLSRIRVTAGQKVSHGSQIGDMGNTGRSTGPHLHYEVRVNGKAVNPMSFIKAAQNVF